MEQEKGIVGPANHAGKREILVSAAPWAESAAATLREKDARRRLG